MATIHEPAFDTATRIAAGDDGTNYDNVAITLHWTTALLVIVQFALAKTWDWFAKPTQERPDDRDAHSLTRHILYHQPNLWWDLSGLSFTLVETPVAPAWHKDYGDAELDALPAHDYVAVAGINQIAVGVATLELET